VALEDVVLFAMRAVRAFHAADEEYSHANRNQNGEDILIDCKPMK
jgi:hypothetical protein